MFITAHGGANKTGRNSKRYLKAMRQFNINAIEVDIRSKSGYLFCAHNATIFIKNKLPLKEVFLYAKERDIMVNCDVKESGLVNKVVSLAQELNMEKNIYFTGSVRNYEIGFLGNTKVYVNHNFFGKWEVSAKCVPEIKKFLDKFKDDRLAGININYSHASEEFLQACKDNNLKVSVFTVDDLKHLERLIKHDELVNITTNKITYAMKLLNR